MDFPQRGAAAGSLSQRDMSVLGQGSPRHFLSDEDHDFSGLLARIDAADLHYRSKSE